MFWCGRHIARFGNDVYSPKRKGVEMAIGWFVLADQVIETSIAEWPLMSAISNGQCNT